MKKPLILLLLFLRMVCFSQVYQNKLVPYSDSSQNGLPVSISSLGESNYFIPILYPDNKSELLKLNTNFGVIGSEIFHDFSVSNRPVSEINEHVFLYGKNRSFQDSTKLLRLDTNEILEFDFTDEGDFNFPTYSLKSDSFLYLLSISDIDNNGGSLTISHLKKVDESGNVLWKKTIGLDEKSTYGRQLYLTQNKDIIIAQVEKRQDFKESFALLRYNGSGDLIWEYNSEFVIRNLGEHTEVTELEDNTLVVTSTPDMRMDQEFRENDWYPFPTRYTWVSAEGEYLRDTFFTTAYENIIFTNRILTAKNGDIISFGFDIHETTDVKSGLINRIDKYGNRLWEKKLSTPELLGPNFKYSITDVKELENNDLIVLLFATSSSSFSKVVLARLNEYGCYGDVTCSDNPIVSNVEIGEKHFDIDLFPNPVQKVLNVNSSEHRINRSLITSLSGELIMNDYHESSKALTLDVSILVNGYYTLTLYFDEGHFARIFKKE